MLLSAIVSFLAVETVAPTTRIGSFFGRLTGLSFKEEVFIDFGCKTETVATFRTMAEIAIVRIRRHQDMQSVIEAGDAGSVHKLFVDWNKQHSVEHLYEGRSHFVYGLLLGWRQGYFGVFLFALPVELQASLLEIEKRGRSLHFPRIFVRRITAELSNVHSFFIRNRFFHRI
jgi:hypothetical protein